MQTSFEQMMAAIDAYQARTGLSDMALSKKMGLHPMQIYYFRKGRTKDMMDRFDMIMRFCGEEGA